MKINQKINKDELRELLDKYMTAETTISTLDKNFGICLFSGNKENFYHQYNGVIFKLLEISFGETAREMMESYVLDSAYNSFTDLWEDLMTLEIN